MKYNSCGLQDCLGAPGCGLLENAEPAAIMAIKIVLLQRSAVDALWAAFECRHAGWVGAAAAAACAVPAIAMV